MAVSSDVSSVIQTIHIDSSDSPQLNQLSTNKSLTRTSVQVINYFLSISERSSYRKSNHYFFDQDMFDHRGKE